MINGALFSSAKDDWETPQSLFDELNKRYHFQLDAAANAKNHKCDEWYGTDKDGLCMPWNSITWINPPYGRSVYYWVRKASKEVKYGNCPIAVMLLPARTDTKWYHEFIYHAERDRFYPGIHVSFLRGRLKFVGAQYPAPFPSMIVEFKKI